MTTSALIPRLCATALFLLPVPALAQANGDPGASIAGQSAAERAPQDKDKGKSGANAMGKGASGGTGSAAVPNGGSNSLSGSGKKP